MVGFSLFASWLTKLNHLKYIGQKNLANQEFQLTIRCSLEILKKIVCSVTMAPKYDLCGVHFQLDEIVRTLVVIFQDLNFYTEQGI